MSTKLGERKCEICSQLQSKYRCPRCETLTCSLTCIKKHKGDSGCSGERNKTLFVSLKDFTDTQLLSDYHFLEGALRTADSAARGRQQSSRYNNRKQIHQLKDELRRRKTFFFFMSFGMTKREENTTHYNRRKRKVFWKVFWSFPLNSLSLHQDRVCEDETLQQVLSNLFNPSHSVDPLLKYKLKKYLNLEGNLKSVSVLMKAERLQCKGIRYYVLDVHKSLCINFRGKCIVEYPELCVVLKDQESDYSIVEPGQHQMRHKGQDASPSNLIRPIVRPSQEPTHTVDEKEVDQSICKQRFEETKKSPMHNATMSWNTAMENHSTLIAPNQSMNEHSSGLNVPLIKEIDKEMRASGQDCYQLHGSCLNSIKVEEGSGGLLVPYSDSEEEGEVISDNDF